MPSSLELYCLVKVFFDQRKTIINCFTPFLLEAARDGSWKPLVQLAQEIESVYRLRIPQHVLNRLVRSAARESLCEPLPNRGVAGTRITETGKETLDKLEPRRDVDRRIQSAVLAFVAFCTARNILLSDDKAEQIMTEFIEINTDPLLTLIHEGKLPTTSPDTKDETSRLFVAFLLDCERSNPTLFATLQDLIHGATIASILNYHQDTFEGIQDSVFSSCTLYFDANYLFYLLGLHSDEFTLAANELYQLILPYGFSLKAFDFTISEMSNVLRGYFHSHNVYPTTVRVNSIYSSLRTKGYRGSDIIELISNLEEKLSKLRIGLKRTGINLTTYKADDKDLLSTLIQYKSYQPTFYQSHDIAVLEKIRSYRKRAIRRFEDAPCFFVTSDYKLAKLNYLDMGHRASQTIVEVISDRMLTTILFLKNPQGTVPIRSIVASYSRKLFIKRHIWDAFYHALCEAKIKGAIDDRALSLMFYNGFIEEDLSDLEDVDTNKIDESYVILEAEKATKRYKNLVELQLSQRDEESKRQTELLLEKQEKEFQSLLNENGKVFLDSLAATSERIKRQKDSELENRIKMLEENVKHGAISDARRIVFFVRIVVGIALVIPVVLLAVQYIQDKVENKTLYSILSISSYLLAVLDGGIQVIKPIWTRVTDRLSESIFRRRRNRLFLNEGG